MNITTFLELVNKYLKIIVTVFIFFLHFHQYAINRITNSVKLKLGLIKDFGFGKVIFKLMKKNHM